jgi:hypothetical protein
VQRRLRVYIHLNDMSLRRTSEFHSNPKPMTAANSLALSLPLLGLIQVPG